MRSFDDSTYAIVDLTASPKPEIAWVNSMKGQGIHQTGFGTTVKNIAGTQMIINWNSVLNSTPADAVAHIIFSGTHAETRAHLVTNKATWVPVQPA